jgi:murein DD-endopeptidase MepM/ murein hydrolase activator NlpD
VRSARAAILIAAAFVVGSAVGGVATWDYLERRGSQVLDDVHPGPADAPSAPTPTLANDVPVPALPSAVVRVGANPLADLRARTLTLPVEGVAADELRPSFDEQRGTSRRHEAIDILAARNTPVLAVEDGTIAKLFTSQAGGLTIYHFDPESKYAYYYAHLERYADGLTEGERVKRGQVIGHVGTSGNAPPDTPHLHFAIFLLADPPKWWQGAPIDPYTVMRSATED